MTAKPSRPVFDSPSVFCRLLDKTKGGFFSVSPRRDLHCTTKQQYLPYSSILRTRSIHEHGAVDVVDLFPRPKSTRVMTRSPASGAGNTGAYSEASNVQGELKKWLVRRVECIRGTLTMGIPPTSPISKLKCHGHADVKTRH